ncbi:MAG TPA: HAD family hydrolase [Candidatus Tumulicola sp.]|jgi:putative hydrolase of the HAD superfamily
MPGGAIGIGFDVDHTIAIDNKLERVAFLRLLEIVAAAGGAVGGSLDDEIERIDALLVRQRAGACSIDDAVRGFVRERGIAAGEDAFVARFRAMAVEMVDQFVIPLPGARQTFEELQARGIRVAVLSNGWNPLQTGKARRAGFAGPVLASADIGVQKPDPRAFALLAAELHVAPERIWYVGDDPRCDVEGARAAGLRAVWLDAEHKAFPPDLEPPAHTVGALAQVVDLVRSAERVASP